MDLAPVRMLHVTAAYTFVDSSVVANASSTNLGAALLRRPRHTGSVGATLSHDRFSASVNGIFIGHFPDNDFAFPIPRTLNPGYTVWDGRASVDVSKQLELVGSIDNIGNASYEEPLGYPTLGRAGRAAAREVLGA